MPRKRLTLHLLIAASLVSCAPHRSAPEPAINVLVYNIHAGKDAKAVPNLARVAEIVRATGADVALLQEVDINTLRSGLVDQAAELADLTGLRDVFGKTLDYDGGEYGIAVLTRWPAVHDTLFRLRVTPRQERAGGSYEPRGVLHVLIATPYGPLHILNTHLDPSADDRFRRQEAATLLRIAGQLRSSGELVFIGGDLNANPDSPVLAMFTEAGWTDAWVGCGEGDGKSYPQDTPVKRIDYLLLGTGAACARAEVLATDASDHRPIIFRIRMRPGRSSTGAAADDSSARSYVGASKPGEDALLTGEERRWVERTLARLTPRERIAQLVMPWVGGEYAPIGSPEFEQVRRWVEEDKVGGLIMSIGTPLAYAVKLNELQRRADVALLVASDMENGPGMRLGNIYAFPSLLPQGGGTVFPPVMALGATRSPELAYELGRVLGIEARAVGVHLAFGPVMDVNSNPLNPVINTRSFGDNPALVSLLASAYIRGARSAGLMTTAKHFPGHGDTRDDSHILLPTIDANRARLDSVELAPFRAAAAEGIDAVMTAHIAVVGVEGAEAPPATLSSNFMTDILRTDLGFRGLVVTDAMTMGGISRRYGATEPLVMAIEAGADVLLMPRDVSDAIEAVASAVSSGRITQERIDRSARKILELKVKAGLHRGRLVSVDAIPRIVNTPPHAAAAAEIAKRSIVLARDSTGTVPLRGSPVRILSVTFADASDPIAGRVFDRMLREGGHSISEARADNRTTPAEYERITARMDSADVVLVSVYVSPRDFAGTVGAEPRFSRFVQQIAARKRPVVAVSFGSPYLLSFFPNVHAYLLAWGGAPVSQAAAAQAILGRAAITGKLPVSIPGRNRYGDGIMREARAIPASQPD